MQVLRVSELMVGLGEYATVSEEATLAEALIALERAQESFNRRRYRHRAVLVVDAQGAVIGKLSQIDVIRALEPRLGHRGGLQAVTRLGFDPEFIAATGEGYGLRRGALTDICATAAKLRVHDIMTTPTPGEYVTEDATLDEAIHQLIVGEHQSLLVMRDERVVGVLRLSDVFEAVCTAVTRCGEHRPEREGER